MTILVVGATGATGQLLVEQLLNRGQNVKVIVRFPEKLPKFTRNNDQLSVISASLLELSDSEMIKYTNKCNAVVSCLGHNLNWKGIYGQPHKLVSDATHRLCNAIKANNSGKPTKYILMNTTGNSNRDLNEPSSFGEKCVIGLIRLLLPPHVDNEMAADYLRTNIGQKDPMVEWVAVRPDNLVNEEIVTKYQVYPSPIRSAIFNAGQTSRINVSHFMADLITEENVWNKWKGQMPVIYNVAST
jgi:hypothetical protein